MSEERKPRSLRLEPAVTEEWVERVLKCGASPNAFAEWLLATVDIDRWLERYRIDRPAAEGKRAKQEAAPDSSSGLSQRGREKRQAISQGKEGWTKERFFDFLEVASSIHDLEWSMALLNAYLELGPMPTSEELQSLCGFREDHAWQQELRIAKQRLTLHARKMEAPSLFPRAKSTTDGKRLHPMEPRLFPWLKEWIASRSSGERGAEGGGLPEPEHWGAAIEEVAKYEELKA